MEASVEDDGTDWAIVRRRSVILSGKKEGKPYVREDFTDSLNSILTCLKDHVAAFGPLARNSEWCLTLKSDAAKDIVLCAGTLSVRGVTFYVRSADKTQFSARVLWAPSYIPNAAIVNVLEETCKVQFIVSEKSTAKGFEGIPTGNRRLVLTGLKDDIPHTFNIINPLTNEKFEILVLIPGRSPLCFRCKGTGHFRSECFTPQCRACGIFGHTYESCAVANSYSSALRGPVKPQSNSTADASIDDDVQYTYRDGRAEPVAPVEGGSGRRVVDGCSSAADLDTPSVSVSGQAAGSAGCSSRPGAEVEPLDSPARPPTALVARDDAIPAWAIVRRRSVILSGKKDGKPYVREDFTNSLVSILESVKEMYLPLARWLGTRVSLRPGVGDKTIDSGDEEIKCWRSGSAAPADFPSYRTSPNRGGLSPQETDPVNRCVGRAFLYILWLGFKHLVNACISFISCSFGLLGRYLIIFASPGQWRWDLYILTNPV